MVVVDASVVYKWITEEDANTDSPALNLLNQLMEAKEDVLIPDIMLYELANVLSTKTNLTLGEVEQAWIFFESINLRITTPTLQFIRKSIKFSRKYHVSVYDASYAVLALEAKCSLFTADNKFVKRTSLPFIKSIDRYQL